MNYWIFYYSLLLLIIIGTFLANGISLLFRTSSIFDIAIYFVVLFPFIILYSSSYANYRHQLTFLRKYSDRIKKDSIQKVPVELHMTSSFWRVPITGSFAQITSKIRHDTFTLIQIDNNIGILGQTYDLGLFRRHFKPIILPITDNFKNIGYSNCSTLYEVEISREVDDLIIIFNNMPHGIKKLKLNNWFQINPTD